MDTIDFDAVIDRRGTDSDKWDRYRDTDILPMWVADSDFLAAPAIVDALRKRIEHGVFGYSHTPAALNDLVVARMQRLYGWQVESEWLVWLPGLVCGLHLACRAVGAPGDTVLSPQPIYPPFMSAPRLSSRALHCVPMAVSQGRSVLDLEALEAAITADSRLLLLCNPHNPGGACYREEELRELAAIAERHDLVVCSDEVHCDLILEPGVTHFPLASLAQATGSRTITLMAPSKTWNVAGLGCSFAIIPDRGLRAAFRRVRKGIVPDVNVLGYTAAMAAYEQGDSWNLAQVDYLRGNRDYLVEQLNAIPGLAMDSPQATYLAWIDVSGARLAQPMTFFEQAGVGLSPGADFGDERFMRLNFACSRQVLEEAVRRISVAMGRHMAA